MASATNGVPKSRWAAGVTPYAEMGYYDADYEPKETDTCARFGWCRRTASSRSRRRRANLRPLPGRWFGPIG